MRIVKIIMFCLFLCGCRATSKTVEKSTLPEKTVTTLLQPLVAEPVVILKEPIEMKKVEIAPRALKKKVIVPRTSVPKENRMTYSQITNLIGEFLDVQVIEDASGYPKYLGASDNGLVSLEIIGEKYNVLRSSLKVSYPDGISSSNTDLNNAMMLRFLRNIAPEFREWSSRVGNIVNEFHSTQPGGTREESIGLDKSIIEVSYDKAVDAITLTARPR